MDDHGPLDPAELASSGAAARAALDAMGELVVVRDDKGRLTEVNAAFLRAFGGAREDWIGRWFAVAPAVGADGGARRYDSNMRTRSGDLWIEWMEYPAGDGGSVAVGRDVTDRRAAEAALSEAARGKSVFFAAVTHELRTPLSGALGAARLLSETELRPDQAAYVDALRNSAGHALALIDDILDLSRLEAGKLSLRLETIDPRALVEEACELLAPKAAEKGLDLAHAADAAVPARVKADPARLRQILFNLVGNAVKFTREGGVLVTLESGRDALRLVVRDSGPGIAPADQARLFNHFERGAAEREGAPGAGLGLAMVKRLAEAMGGLVGVESREGEGAAFWVDLPLPVLSGPPGVKPLKDLRVDIRSPSAIRREALERQVRALGGRARSDDHADAGEDAEIVLLDEAFAGAAPSFAPARVLILARPQTKDRYGLIARPPGVDGWLVMPARAASLAQFARPDAHLAGCEDPAGSGDADPSGADPAPLRGLVVLVAEDDPVNALIAERVLDRLGATVRRAEHGPAALQALRDGVDAALIDLRMPGMDGLELARRRRAEEAEAGETARTPLVALTANATEADREACLAAGMDDFLTKPVEPAALARALAPRAGDARGRLCGG